MYLNTSLGFTPSALTLNKTAGALLRQDPSPAATDGTGLRVLGSTAQ